MNRTGLSIIVLLCMPGCAIAACESHTDRLKSGTVAFMCQASGEPQDQAVRPSDPANVSVVRKSPDPIPALLPSPAAGLTSRSAGQDIVNNAPSAVEPATAASAPAKLDKKFKRPAKSKKAKAASRKSTKQKTGRIIHLEKPRLGRRIMQFLGL